jgi:LysR family cyn operon transcriptional activator
VAAFHQQHPAVRVSITVRGTEELFAAVAAEQLDLGVCGLPAERHQSSDLLTVQELRRDPFVLGLVSDHPLAQVGGSVTMAQIAELPLALLDAQFATRHVIEQAFAERNIIPPQPLLEINNVVALKQIVQHGVGATILPRSLFTRAEKKSITTLPISDLNERLVFAIVYRRTGELAPPAHAFIHALTTSVAEQ